MAVSEFGTIPIPRKHRWVNADVGESWVNIDVREDGTVSIYMLDDEVYASLELPPEESAKVIDFFENPPPFTHAGRGVA